MPTSSMTERLCRFSQSILRVFDALSPHVSALISLAMRIWLGLIFWKSGLTKIVNWETTLFLYEEEYQVPFLPPDVAAYLSTGAELILPLMLLAGFGTRIAATGLLIMTAVIQLTYDANHQHIVWGLVALALILQGAGHYSVDFFLRAGFLGDTTKLGNASAFFTFLITGALVVMSLHELVALFLGTPYWWEGLLKTWQSIGSA